MKRAWPFLVVGVILIAAGVIWTLQGFNVIGGSVMSGSSLWAVLGPIVFLVGLVAIVIAVLIARRRTH